MHLALVYQDYWGIVSGQTTCPPEEPAWNETRDDYNAWHTENSQACYFILSNMTPLYQKYYKMRNPNAHQLWKQLETDYRKPPVEIDFYGLRSRLMSITLEKCGNVEDYANDIQNVVRQYNRHASRLPQLCEKCRKSSPAFKDFSNFTHDDDDEAAQPVGGHEHVFALLRGLPNSLGWRPCVEGIKKSYPSILGKPTKVIQALKETEMHILYIKAFGHDTKDCKKGGKKGKGRDRGSRGGQNSNVSKHEQIPSAITCSKCLGEGHNESDRRDGKMDYAISLGML